MSPYVRLGELLLKWEELRNQGQTVSPEEVCRDCPELADDFKRLIASLESRGSAPSAPSATAVAPPTPLEQAVSSGEQPATAPQPAAAVSSPTPKAAETPAPPSSGNVRLLTNSVGMKLVLIPPGEFQMGSPDSDPDADTDEKPHHRVRISKAFYLGACPVTLGQMRAFVSADGYRTDAETDGDGGWGFNPAARKFEGRKPHYTWQTTGWDQSDNHPVINVSWNDARAFCAWLSAKERRSYRLPTEAEWEYACRAGTTTRFYGDNHVDVLRAIAVVRRLAPGADAFPFTAPVGRMKANAFGPSRLTIASPSPARPWRTTSAIASRRRPDAQLELIHRPVTTWLVGDGTGKKRPTPNA